MGLHAPAATAALILAFGTERASAAVGVEEPPSPQAAAHPDAERAIKLIQIPKGLRIDVWAQEPLLRNPVAMSFDERGRAWVVETFRLRDGTLDNRSRVKWLGEKFKSTATPARMEKIADELLDRELAARTVDDRLAFIETYMDPGALGAKEERIEVVWDGDGDGRADRSQVFAAGFGEPLDGIAAGVLPRGRDVFFTNIPHLWLLRDTSGDGVADTRRSLHRGFGVRYAFTGHDLHGPRIGPDGRLYFSIGDRGTHVETEGRVLAVPDTGAVFRCELDGSGLEVFATGLRNPQDLVFDAHGNLFTGDNDSDVEDPRWVHLVEGGDSGWRIGYQYLGKTRGPWIEEDMCFRSGQLQPAFIVPPVAIIANGPSGATVYPGTGLGPNNDGRFFLADFKGQETRSGVLSFFLEARGAGFEMRGLERWVWGVLATDVDFGVDGGLYILDWVQGWEKSGKGRIYRVHDPALAGDALVRSTKRLIADGMTRRPERELVGLLSHPDMRVRQEAQFRLVETCAAPAFADVAMRGPARQARLHAVWGLGQVLRAKAAAGSGIRAMSGKTVLGLLGDRDDEVRAQAARVLGDGGADATLSARTMLRARLEDASPRVQMFAALALGRLRDGAAVSSLLSFLERAGGDPILRHAGVMGLVGCADPAVLAGASGHASARVRMGALLALRRLGHADVARFLADPDPAIVREAARAINDQPIDAAGPALASLRVASDPSIPTLLRIANANFRLGTSEAARRLVALARAAELPARVRAEAVAALGDWGEPSGRDRVTGLWHPIPATARDAGVAAAALAPASPGLLARSPGPVPLATVRAMRNLRMTGARKDLAALAASRRADGALRAEALSTLGALAPAADLARVVRGALRDRDEKVRLQALRLAVRAAPSRSRPLLARAMARGTVAEKQVALDSLALLDEADAAAILARWLDDLLAGKTPPALVLDLIEAAERRPTALTRQKIAAYDARRPPDELGRFVETLHGGDRGSGKKIFEKGELGCQRCHRLAGPDGGDVGPDLKGVGKRRDRAFILAAIVAPNREMAEGFESVLLTMKNGDVYGGIVKSENDETVEILSPDAGRVVLRKRDVKDRQRGASSMPEGFGDILSRRDLRDLIEYLAAQ